jgi:GntR family transcriptional regulator, transcriptional repressor for pyruvate dehydrogenase complex
MKKNRSASAVSSPNQQLSRESRQSLRTSLVTPRSFASGRNQGFVKRRAQFIAQEIRTAVVRGGLKPGAPLSKEKALIDQYGSSRATVREALAILEAQGLVAISPGRYGGVVVAAVPAAAVLDSLQMHLYFEDLTWHDIYQARLAVEPEITRIAAPALDRDAIAGLQTSIERCNAGLAGRLTPREHKIAEIDFHEIISRGCPNPVMRVIGLFLCRAEHEMIDDLLTFDTAEASRQVIKEHQELLEAIRDRDCDRAADLMREHLEAVETSVVKRKRERERVGDRTTANAPVTGKRK